MGRKSIAEKILKRFESADIEDLYPSLNKLLVYDFKGRKITTRFFQNLERLLRKTGGFRVQYSVVNINSMKGAKAVKELAQHYNCEDVRIYAVEEIE